MCTSKTKKGHLLFTISLPVLSKLDKFSNLLFVVPFSCANKPISGYLFSPFDKNADLKAFQKTSYSEQ